MFEAMTIPYQVWILVGLAFLVADLAMPGLVLSFAGLGCLLGALAAWLVPTARPLFPAGVALAGFLIGLLLIRPPLVRARRRRKEKARAAEAPETSVPNALERRRAPRPEPSPLETQDLFEGLSAPPVRTHRGPARPLSLLDEEDEERSGFDLLEPVLDDGLRLSIDEEDALLLTEALPDSGPVSRPLEAPEAEDGMRLDFPLDLEPKPREALGRTVTVVRAVGPFTAGQVDLDGRLFRAYCDESLKPGAKARVVERMKEDPDTLVVEPAEGISA